MIILIEENVWSCYSDCYSALHAWRATVANLKKKLELPSLLECLFCVNSVCCSPKFGFAESVGDALRGFSAPIYVPEPNIQAWTYKWFLKHWNNSLFGRWLSPILTLWSGLFTNCELHSTGGVWDTPHMRGLLRTHNPFFFWLLLLLLLRFLLEPFSPLYTLSVSLRS